MSLKTKIALFIAFLLPNFVHAQNAVEPTTGLYANGKIYVVVLVISTIFVGIILFLIYLERKIKSLEKRNNNNQ